MNSLMIFFFVIILLLSLITLLISIISSKSMIETQKSTPFECGFNSMSMKRSPFSIHFFLIAVIFLVFDIEIIIILPMVITMNCTLMLYWILTSSLFILILILGLYYEWSNGMLNWAI